MTDGQQVVLLFQRREGDTLEPVLSQLVDNYQINSGESSGKNGKNIILMLRQILTPSLSLGFTGQHACVTIELDFLKREFSYFKSMFELGMKESQTGNAEMHGIGVMDFLHLVYHIVNGTVFDRLGECNLCRDNKELLFNATDAMAYLNDHDTLRTRLDVLVDRVCPENCLGLLVRAYQYSHRGLFSRALKFALCHADTVLKQNDELSNYLQSPHSQIIHFYLTHPMLNSDRLQLDQLSLLSELLGTQASATPQKVPHVAIDVQVTNKCVELSLVGSDDERNGHPLLKTNIELGATNGLPFIGYSVCTFNEFVYVSGGELGLGKGKWNEQIFEINTVQGAQHVNIVPYQMPDKRRHHKSCSNRNALYIAGGHDKYRCKRYEVFKISVQHSPTVSTKDKFQRLADVPDTVDALKVTDDGKFLSALCCGDVWVLPLDQDQSAADWLPATDEQKTTFGWDSLNVHTTTHQVVWFPDFQLPKLPA